MVSTIYNVVKTESTRSSSNKLSGQKPCSTKIIYSVLKTSVGLFSIASKNNSFLATPNVENEC